MVETDRATGSSFTRCPTSSSSSRSREALPDCNKLKEKRDRTRSGNFSNRGNGEMIFDQWSTIVIKPNSFCIMNVQKGSSSSHLGVFSKVEL